jgi:hypothetical protein
VARFPRGKSSPPSFCSPFPSASSPLSSSRALLPYRTVCLPLTLQGEGLCVEGGLLFWKGSFIAGPLGVKASVDSRCPSPGGVWLRPGILVMSISEKAPVGLAHQSHGWPLVLREARTGANV